MQTASSDFSRLIGRIALLRRLAAILVVSAGFVAFAVYDRAGSPPPLAEPAASNAVAAPAPDPLPLFLESAELARGKLAFERGDYRAAHDDLLIAAIHGEPLAQEVIGFMYALGTSTYPGISQNLAAAGEWLDLAARNGRPAARHFYCSMVRKAFPERQLSELNCFDAATVEDRH